MYLTRPIGWLRLAIGLVIGQASLLLLLHPRHGGTEGVHPLHAAVLAGVEVVSAALFLIPKTVVVGAWLLLGVLLAATLLHLHAGEVPSPVFLVYAAGIGAVLEDVRRGKKDAVKQDEE
jgi:hypothetical protein